MATFGDDDCAGAIFIFKNDGTEVAALAEAAEVAKKHRLQDTFTEKEKARIVETLGYDPTDSSGRFVYVVHTTDREEFLTLLSAWHDRTRQHDAALLIYSHMGEGDIGPDEESPGVMWRELGETLSAGVGSLWLAGCESDHCMNEWAKAPSLTPVRNWLVSTSESIYWLPLMPHFTMELSVEPGYTPTQIAASLSKAFPDKVRVFQREDKWTEVAAG